MALGPRPLVLWVESDSFLPEVYRPLLADLNLEVLPAFTNEQALAILERVRILRLHLALLITNLVHPVSTGGCLEDDAGLRLVRAVRGMPPEALMAGGLRIRHIPIIIHTGYPCVGEYLARQGSDSVLLLLKPCGFREFFTAVDQALSSYRARLQAELHELGIALIWRGGRFRVLSANEMSVPARIEDELFSGHPSTVVSAVSRLLLLHEQRTLAEAALVMLEELLNSQKATERDFHEFFRLHPNVLLGHDYGDYWSEPRLWSEASGKVLKPDFVLQPRADPTTASWNWAVVDLKRPQVPLVTGSSFHRDLSHQVYRLATQLRDYEDYFLDPRNQEALKARFGGVVPVPKLVGIIGRLPRHHGDHYALLRRRLPGVCITTYDEILEAAQSRADLLASLSAPTWIYDEDEP